MVPSLPAKAELLARHERSRGAGSWGVCSSPHAEIILPALKKSLWFGALMLLSSINIFFQRLPRGLVSVLQCKSDFQIGLEYLLPLFLSHSSQKWF